MKPNKFNDLHLKISGFAFVQPSLHKLYYFSGSVDMFSNSDNFNLGTKQKTFSKEKVFF